jgi:hypothetical protein
LSGWILKIRDYLGILAWEGYKIIGDKGEGLYLIAADSPNQTVPCILVAGV